MDNQVELRNLTVLEKEKIRYRTDRLARAKATLEYEQYHYANFICFLKKLDFDLSEYHSPEEIAELQNTVDEYLKKEKLKNFNEQSRWEQSDEVRRAKANKRQNSTGPKRRK